MKLLFVIFLLVYGDLGYSGDFILYPSKDKKTEVSPHHFNNIYNYIRQNIEGNYVNHPHDKGRETYGGISRKNHPDWKGWYYVDKAKPLKRHDAVPEAEFYVKDFYLTIWIQEGFENIENYQVALNLFDFRIHSSPRTVQKKVNKVLEELGCDPVIVSDNWIDERFNQVEPSEFILRLKIQRLILFNFLISKDKSQLTFYKGWTERLTNI